MPGISGLLRGFNGGLTVSALHDAVTGWATVSQPAIGYSFNDIFAIDLTLPIYNYRLAQTHATNPKPNQLLVPLRAELGNVSLALHAQFLPPHLQYETTITASIPTGDELYGLSSGRVTFDLNNHFEHSFTWVTPSLELGVGDSTNLVNPLVLKNFSSLGPLAHFQLGLAFELPFGASFGSNVYEELPIGDQKIYQSVKRGKTTTLVVAGRSITEDNGFINSLDIPFGGHTTLSAYYSRSLRLHDDVVSVGLTYVLRKPRQPPETGSADELLRAIDNAIDKQPASERPANTPVSEPPKPPSL